jgi:hypothetical protein
LSARRPEKTIKRKPIRRCQELRERGRARDREKARERESERAREREEQHYQTRTHVVVESQHAYVRQTRIRVANSHTCGKAGVSPRLLGGARVGRCHGLAEEHTLAFAMGTHARLGAGAGAGGGAGGQRRSRRVQGKAPKEGEDRGCLYMMMQEELVRMMVEACKWKPPPELGEGVARLMGVF